MTISAYIPITIKCYLRVNIINDYIAFIWKLQNSSLYLGFCCGLSMCVMCWSLLFFFINKFLSSKQLKFRIKYLGFYRRLIDDNSTCCIAVAIILITKMYYCQFSSIYLQLFWNAVSYFFFRKYYENFIYITYVHNLPLRMKYVKL